MWSGQNLQELLMDEGREESRMSVGFQARVRELMSVPLTELERKMVGKWWGLGRVGIKSSKQACFV